MTEECVLVNCELFCWFGWVGNAFTPVSAVRQIGWSNAEAFLLRTVFYLLFCHVSVIVIAVAKM